MLHPFWDTQKIWHWSILWSLGMDQGYLSIIGWSSIGGYMMVIWWLYDGEWWLMMVNDGYITGWWYTYPSESQLGLWNSQYMESHKKCSKHFQTTNHRRNDLVHSKDWPPLNHQVGCHIPWKILQVKRRTVLPALVQPSNECGPTVDLPNISLI